MKKAMIALLLLFLLSACGFADGASSQPPDDVPPQTALPELETPAWQTLSTDAETFNLNGSLDNPHFEYVFDHTDMVPLDQLVAFSLVADGASESARYELRVRFLEAPNTVLVYFALLGDQITEYNGQKTPTAELICDFIASADAAWYDGSEEFAATMEQCRKTYPEGRIAELLDIMQEKHSASMERHHSIAASRSLDTPESCQP